MVIGATKQLGMHGAKSVDGFDVQEKMVTLARQATSHGEYQSWRCGGDAIW